MQTIDIRIVEGDLFDFPDALLNSILQHCKQDDTMSIFGCLI